MLKKTICILVSGLAVIMTDLRAEMPARVKVNADRVNLRAKPDQQSETVGQVQAGTLLEVKSMGDEWVEVVPPETVDFWVHQEFVSEDTVIANKLNARSGAGINYSVSGTFVRGDKIQRRGVFGEWIKVAAPADARLWVSRLLVDVPSDLPPPVAAPAIEAVEPAPEALAMPAGAEAPDVPMQEEAPVLVQIEDVVPEPVAPAGVKLMQVDGQGKMVQREGLLKRAPALMFNAPGAHRLVKREGNNVITTAYLRGNTSQLNSLLDQQLLIRGREYWVEGAKVPLIVIEAIEKRSFY